MNIGRMRHRITIKRKAAGSPDAYRQRQLSWTPVCSLWAEIKPLAQSEKQTADHVATVATHEFLTRYTPASITSEDRIAFGSRTFEIIEVLNLYEQGRTLKFKAAEIQ